MFKRELLAQSDESVRQRVNISPGFILSSIWNRTVPESAPQRVKRRSRHLHRSNATAMLEVLKNVGITIADFSIEVYFF
jgi:hypothetical protein